MSKAKSKPIHRSEPARSSKKQNRAGSKRSNRKHPQAQEPPTRRQRLRWLLKWGAIFGLLAAAVGTATIASLFWMYGSDPKLPQIQSINDYRPAQVNRVLTADGELIGELFEQRRSIVPFDELPKVLVDAFVSAEDKGFWKHQGIDYVGMLRAVLVNVREGKKKQGASTITQQVVKNLLLTPERTYKRKFQEIILARRLEQTLSKEEIITLYANEIFLGHRRYGVQEASRFYFAKNVQDINVGEAALLAGLPKAPNRYSPKKAENQDRAKDRQVYVISEMVQNGYLSEEDGQKWIDEPIKVVADASPKVGTAPEFVELAKAELVAKIGEDALVASGAVVVTTVDLEIQRLAREALQANLRIYDERKKFGRPLKHLKEDKLKLELIRMGKKHAKRKLRPKTVYRAMVLAVDDKTNSLSVDLGAFETSLVLGGPQDERFNPQGAAASKRFKRGSVVRVVLAEPKKDSKERSVRLAPGPEGAVVIIDPKTRRLVAMVGGYDTKLAGFNRATMAKRQAGSTFKPFVYGAAIDSGDFTAASIVNDAPEVYDLWKPENYKKGAFAGPVRLRHALAKSINTVAIRVAHDIGPTRIREFAQSLGIESKLPDGLSLALGSGEVTPLELTNAFATFAAGGMVAPVRSVAKIGDEDIAVSAGVSALSPEVAYIVVDMMRSVISEGTGVRASKLGLDIAGKTGTSNKARDAWFVGMSPGLVVGVWVGFDDFRRELGRGEGGSKTALPVFIDIMKELGDRSARFTEPPSVATARIDRASGLLASDAAASDESSYDEVFLEGSVPTEVATAPGEVNADDAILDQYGDFDEQLEVPATTETP